MVTGRRQKNSSKLRIQHDTVSMSFHSEVIHCNSERCTIPKTDSKRGISSVSIRLPKTGQNISTLPLV